MLDPEVQKNLANHMATVHDTVTTGSFKYRGTARRYITLQSIMEGQFEKKAGITFGPPGNMYILCYIEDLNMPFVDKYGTQEPIAFLRCFVDYELKYEREKLDKSRDSRQWESR